MLQISPLPVTRPVRRTLLAFGLTVLPIMAAAQSAIVMNTNDSGTGSLRAAVDSGIASIETWTPADSTITLTSGPLTFSYPASRFTIQVGDALTIAGDDLVLAAGDYTPPFELWNGNPSGTVRLTIDSNITGRGHFLLAGNNRVTLVLRGTNTFVNDEGTSLSVHNHQVVEIHDGASTGAGRVVIGPDGILRVAQPATIGNEITTLYGTIEVFAETEITSAIVNYSLTKRGSGDLILSGANTYTGTTWIEAGRLITRNGTALPDEWGLYGGVIIAAGAWLELRDSETIGALEGEGNVWLGPSSTLTVNQYIDTTLSGDIAGPGNLVKANIYGTLTVTGHLGHEGSTIVEAGWLALASTATVARSVTVRTGGTLILDGTVEGDVIVEAGATIEGDGQIIGNLLLGPGATVEGSVAVDGETITAPVITSADTASGTYRNPFTAYTLTADNDAVDFAVTAGALPAGLTLDTSTGVISGTPTESGVFAVTLEASNEAGTDTLDLDITIAKATVTPVIVAADKLVDGTAEATLTSCTLSGALGGDVQLTCGPATFADALPANGKVVTVTGLTLGGADVAHYTLASATATTTASILGLPEPELTHVDAGQVVDGRAIEGPVENRGTILNATLQPGGEIRGGTVGGTIKGTPGNPGLIDAFVRAGTSLQHVRLGPDAVLHPSVRVGAGVCFMSAASIPRGLPLDGLMPRAEGADVLQLSAPVICDAAPFIATLRGIAGNIVQDAEGRLVLQVPAGRVALWPVAVFQGDPAATSGYSVDIAGNLRLVADGGIVVVAWPALQDERTFAAGLATLQLTLRQDDANGNFVLDPSNGSGAAVNHRFSGRPHFVALPLADDIEPGLYLVPQHGTQLPLATVVFQDDDAVLLAQYVVPAPGDWESLRENLLNQPGAESARIDIHGVIHALFAGNAVRGIMDYRIERGDAPISGRLEWRDMGDVNGDGIADLLVIYANGDRQLLYRMP